MRTDTVRLVSGAFPPDGRHRVFVSSISPRVERGRFAAKRVVGDTLTVSADLVADGHDVVRASLKWRAPAARQWFELEMTPKVNDRFVASIPMEFVGTWELAIEAWVDSFETWHHGLSRRAAAHDVSEVDLAIGAELIRSAANRSSADPDSRQDTASLRDLADRLSSSERATDERVQLALSDRTYSLVRQYPDRGLATVSDSWPLSVEPSHAAFASWYEFFPRSTGKDGRHGNFATATEWLPYVRDMGFDVVYLPPIHPIGTSHRKGKNNSLGAGTDQPGSPWAIGGPEGGHTAVHPELGTLADFDKFVSEASAQGLQVALDIAFQSSPDHPWVKEHPQWFKRRPDGTIQYAENPPKKYQDVYPFDFECDDWQALWAALRDVFLFWIGHGVRIFRVDNPHTKPIGFWEWCIRAVKEEHPDVTFLSEAFTRPHLKYALAKVGFSQGYTYFTWRSTKHEITKYLEELTQTEVADFFRPSFWPNTPDILPEDLQYGGRPSFLTRLILAGTLSSHYGVYGPAFELMDHVARPNSGEYLDNEKYQIKQWDRSDPESLRPAISLLNRVRREHPALHRNDSLRFHPTDNDFLLCYSKTQGEDGVIVVVNLDFHHRQAGFVDLDLEALGIEPNQSFQVHDRLGGGRYLWHGSRNYVEIDPHAMPAQLFVVRRKVRSERDFDYYL